MIDDIPVAGDAAELAVDEDDLPAGNNDMAAGDDLALGSPTSVTGGLGVSFGADGPGGVTNITYTGAALNSQGSPVVFSFDGTDTLTAYVESGDAPGLDVLDRQVFTVAVDPSSGEYTFTLLDSLDHPDNSTEDNLVLTFDAVVTDVDGDSVTQGLSVDVDDDSPVAITPESETLVNQPNSISNDNPPPPYLDDDQNIDDDVGADQVGTIAFANITNGDQATGVINGETVNLTSGGELIQLFLVDHDTDSTTPDRLEGWTGGLNTGTKIFQVTLNPDGDLLTSNDTYNVELFEQIGAVTTTVLDDLGFDEAGNKAFNFITVDDPSTTSDTEALLFSGYLLNANGSFNSIGTVNSNSTAIGVNNQSMNDGEVLGIDFANNVSVSNSANNTYNYTSHYTINDFSFAIVQDNTPGNPGPDHIELWVRIYDVDDDDPGGNSTATHHNEITPSRDTTAPLEVQIQITEITVNVVSLNLALLDDDSNGGYLIDGLNLNDVIVVTGASNYERLEIENPLVPEPDIDGLNGESIDIGQFAFSRETTNIPAVTMAYDLSLSDSDGDSVEMEDAINITLTAPTSPVVLDLDGDGLEFVAMDGKSGNGFDFDGDGIKEMSAWIGPDDGFLAYDSNGDNIVNDKWELVFSALHPDARTDLEGLRLVFDSNEDGYLTEADDAFSDFGVWQDINGNHVTDPGEFKSLSQLKITSIDLTSDEIKYETADGQVTVYGEGTYSTKSGKNITEGQLGDVSLELGGEIFDYNAISDSTPDDPDTISGFDAIEDIIDVSDIDANVLTDVDDEAFLYGGNNTEVVANSITWYQADGNTYVQADVNGDTVSDFEIEITGLHNLDDSDFVL